MKAKKLNRCFFIKTAVPVGDDKDKSWAHTKKAF